MNNNQNPRSEKINLGEKDGINVYADVENSRYIVELPNSYDVYWGFNASPNGQEFATRLPNENNTKALFAVPLDNLVNNAQIRNFNIKVNEARKISSEINEERKQFTDALAFDQAKDNKTVAFLYKNPIMGWCRGEVLKTGKYFVALTSGENDDKVFVRILHTSRLLNGKDEFSNREESIQKMFPLGSEKYLAFKDGKIAVRDYTPKATVEQKPLEQPGASEAEQIAKQMTEQVLPKQQQPAQAKRKTEPKPLESEAEKLAKEMTEQHAPKDKPAQKRAAKVQK